jgi:glycosyltransferase involved in cell wall biosynthesis
MKILSFTNLPMPGFYQYLGKNPHNYQGWVEGMREALKSAGEIQLAYVSTSLENVNKFNYDGDTYYNIRHPALHRFLQAWIDQWQHPIDFTDAERQWMEIIDDFKPDAIHINGTEGMWGLLRAPANIPVVISIQGLLTSVKPQFFRGMNSLERGRLLLKYDFLRGTGPVHEYLKMKKAAVRELEIIKLNRNFIGRTEWDRHFIQLVNPTAHYYHCDEVLRPEFYQREWTVGGATPGRLYFLARPSAYKGIDCLLQALWLLKGIFPGIHLHVSGGYIGSPYWDWIHRLARRLGILDRITWLGETPAEKVADEMQKAAIYVHPTYIDNSPNSLAEAMLIGMPCIASSAGGIPSMVEHGKNGLLFSAGDAYGLAANIQRLLNSQALSLELSKNALKTARQRHEPVSIAARMIEIFNGLIGRPWDTMR